MSSLRFYLGFFFSLLLAMAVSCGQDIAPLLQDSSLWYMSPQTLLNDLLKNKSAKTLENKDAGVYIISSSNMPLPTDGKANDGFNTLNSQPLSRVTWSWSGVRNHAEEWLSLCSNPANAAACEQARLLWLSGTLCELQKGEKKTQQDLNKIEQDLADLLKSVTGAKCKRVVNKDTATCREVTLRGECKSCVISLNITFQYAEGTKKVHREKELEKGVVEIVIAKDAEGMLAYDSQQDVVLTLNSAFGGSTLLFEKALLNGTLWHQSPQMVYDAYLKEKIYQAIDDDIIHSNYSMFTSFSGFIYSRDDFYWFWSAPDSNESPNVILADRALHWAQAWLHYSKISDTERYELFRTFENRRPKRISVMIYRAEKKQTRTAPPKIPDLIKKLDTFCSQKGKQETDKRDALGRKIKSWIWEADGKYTIMLEQALQANSGKTDYVRLSFAPDAESLMYLRTDREHIATAEELAERAKNPSKLTGFKPYKRFGFAKDGNPNIWSSVSKDTSVLLYYGLGNIDDNSYQDAVKQVKKVDLKSHKEAIALYNEAIRGVEKEDAYVQSKETAGMSFFQTVKSYIDRGIPVIDTANILQTPYMKPKGKYVSIIRSGYSIAFMKTRTPRTKKEDSSSYTFWCGYAGNNSGSIRSTYLNSGFDLRRSVLFSWIYGGHVYVLLPIWNNASK